MKRYLPTILVALALGAAVWWLWTGNQRLRGELQTARAVAAEAARLREANQALQAGQVNADELARLRAGQAELLSLRGEVTRLRRELQQATNALARERQAAARRPEPPAQAPAPAAPEPPAVSFTSQFTARVGDGESVVSGGWVSGPGRRTLAIVSPSFAGTPGQITINAQFIDAPDAAWAQLGLGDIQADGPHTSQVAALAKGQGRVLLSALRDQPGVTLLGGPRVTTSDGAAAQVSTASGTGQPGASAAPTINLVVTPRLTPDRSAVEMAVSLNLSPLTPATQPGR